MTHTLSSARPFTHSHAAHCESGVAANLLSYHGIQLSEAMAFGLSSALSFAYLPMIRLTGFPLISYRMPPQFILKGLRRRLHIPLVFETFRTPEAGMQRLDALLAQGQVVGLQTSVYWLPYFPEDMRFHFNAHNLLVYGKEGDAYLISDPVAETVQRCASADLQRARFAKGILAPKGLLYYPQPLSNPGSVAVTAPILQLAIRKTVRIMLGPIPFVGVRGMRRLAQKLHGLEPSEWSLNYVGHMVRMQEEIGTGGGGFRFLYAAFLQEAAPIMQQPALQDMAEQLNAIGDQWRYFALQTVRMIKGRTAFAPQLLAQLLLAQADAETQFFRQLKRILV